MAQTTRLIEEQVRRNTEMFRQAMGMFNPFMAAAAEPAARGEAAPPSKGDDLASMREEIAEMQKKLDALAKPN